MSLLHVFDLPQIYTRPSADVLLEALSLLTSAPPSWDGSDAEDNNNGSHISGRRRRTQLRDVRINPEGVTAYLTSIISCDLRWITDDAIREQIWDQASFRLSERSGRSAMGALSRTFTIPTQRASFDLTIHEPALTADNLGLKTWAASYLLAKRLHKFDFTEPPNTGRLEVLELGSGTGLVGMAMAGLGADVVLTDLPSIFHNLAHNVRGNAEIVTMNQGSMRSGVLDWTVPERCELYRHDAIDADEDSEPINCKFPIILAADSLYSPEHPRWLVQTIKHWLSQDENARVVVEFPLRDAYLPEIKNFREQMHGIGLRILEEGEESGYDDWGWSGEDDDSSDAALVKCWWSCWGRDAV